MTTSKIMSYSCGQSAAVKLAAQIIDNLGCVKLYCGVHNDPKILIKLKNKLDFSRSIAEIAVAEGKINSRRTKGCRFRNQGFGTSSKGYIGFKGYVCVKAHKERDFYFLVTFCAATEKLDNKNKKMNLSRN